MPTGPGGLDGMGVRAQDNWPTVLERMLQTARGGPVQVINAGMACGNGARSAAEYALRGRRGAFRGRRSAAGGRIENPSPCPPSSRNLRRRKLE